jgi:hypothetical protein
MMRMMIMCSSMTASRICSAKGALQRGRFTRKQRTIIYSKQSSMNLFMPERIYRYVRYKHT